MESRAKIAGHPIHPMLIVFPLGLWVAGVIFDIVYLITSDETFGTIGFWNILAGMIGALLAAVFGLIDWLAIPDGTRAKRVGLLHGGGNVVVLLLFFIAWFLRRDEPENVPTTVALVLEVLALLLGTVTAWLGGELVDRLGVGVDDGANLNAPNSMSGQPAHPSVAGEHDKYGPRPVSHTQG
jgi:uncharacterized membrane protein